MIQLWPRIDSYYIDLQYLGITRIVYCILVCTFLGLPSYAWLGSALDYFFAPPKLSIAHLFSGFPGYGFFYGLTLLNISFFCLMFAGLWGRYSSLAFSLTCILGHNFWYSFGKIDHLLLWIIAPIFLGFAGWSEHFTVHKLANPTHIMQKTSKQLNSLLVYLLAVSIAFSMFTSGIQKVAGGWLSWNSEAVHFHLIKNYYSLERAELLASWFLPLKNHVFWKLMDYATLVFEIGFLISVFNVKMFRTFILVAIIFHFMVLIMFNIPFYSNVLVYSIFIDWKYFDQRFRVFTIIRDEIYYRRCTKIILSLSLAFFLYWSLYLFLEEGVKILPGIVETVFNVIDYPDGYKYSLYMFFTLSIIAVLFIIALFIKRFFIQKLHFRKCD